MKCLTIWCMMTSSAFFLYSRLISPAVFSNSEFPDIPPGERELGSGHEHDLPARLKPDQEQGYGRQKAAVNSVGRSSRRDWMKT